MKLKGVPPGQVKAWPRHKGRYYTRKTPHGPVVQSWPAPGRQKPTPWALYSRGEFALAATITNRIDPIARLSAMAMAQDTQYVWRDIVMMGLMGTLYTITMPDGTVVTPARRSVTNPQLVLDMVGTTVGAMLWRDTVGWVLLTPGNSGDVIQMVLGRPTWSPSAVGLSASFLLASSDPSLVNARVIAVGSSLVDDLSTAGVILLKRAALTGDVTSAQDSNTLTIASNAVTYAKFQAIASSQRLVGRNSTGSGNAEEVTLSQALDWLGSCARGDLAFRGSTAWQRLAAGTAGQVLSTNGSGGDPAWIDAASGLGTSGIGATAAGCFWRNTNTFLTPMAGADSSPGTLAVTANILYQVPIVVPTQRAFTAIGFNITSAVASSLARLGIYRNATDSNGGPGALLVDAGTVATTATGKTTVAVTQTLVPGIYWLAAVFDHAPTITAVNTSFSLMICGYNFGSGTVGPVRFLRRAFTFASLPSDETSATYDEVGATVAATNVPLIGIR